MTRWTLSLIVVWLLAAPPSPEATVTAAPGYGVRTIPAPGPVQGGVVRRGPAIIVGQGSFGAAGEYIVRFEEGGGAVIIADGFNSLGGFDLAPDGTLYVVDNGGDLSGAVSGDTVYAIADALTRATAVAAADAEVIPSGSIAAPQDVVRAADGSLYVSDARGPGLGRVVQVTPPSILPFATGLDYTAGISLDGAGGLLVGNVDAGFAGALTRHPLDGSPATPIASGLAGIYTAVVDGGAALVSGGFTSDFSSSTVVAIDLAPPHAATERARGFGFSADMFHDAARDETLVLDFGASAVTAICREQDGDGVCDADDACTFPAVLDAARIGFGKKFVLKGRMVVPTAPALDPLTRGARVRVVGARGLVLDEAVPGGAFDRASETGWKVRKGKYSWKGNVGGITSVKIKTDAEHPGEVQFAAGGLNPAWTVGPGDLPLGGTAALVAQTGQCAEVAFTADHCKYNTRRHVARCR